MDELQFKDFLNTGRWDNPFFKILARNDSGEASGHQGGVVIPIPLREFFPNLDDSEASIETPTVDRRVAVELFVCADYITRASARYQFQTWGGTRSAESRLTDNLGPIRDQSKGGDFLLFQRSIDHLDLYRLILVPQTSPLHSHLLSVVGSVRWGPLNQMSQPISQSELLAAKDDMLAEVAKPFVVTRMDVPRQLITRSKIARGTAFRETLLNQYNRACSVSGIALRTQQLAEAQAAHVIALSDGGADEPRNGFTLTGSLHWAFDNGLFVIDPDRRVYVPNNVRSMQGNQWLSGFHGKQIVEARSEQLRTAQEAFDFHREKFLSS